MDALPMMTVKHSKGRGDSFHLGVFVGSNEWRWRHICKAPSGNCQEVMSIIMVVIAMKNMHIQGECAKGEGQSHKLSLRHYSAEGGVEESCYPLFNVSFFNYFRGNF